MDTIDTLGPGAARRPFRPFALLIAAALMACPAAWAETLYVTDILRLGLHRASDTSDSPFRILASGDALEILERSTYYARVRTDDGTEGWVKASYLTDEKPAQARLAELTAARDRLQAEVAALTADLARTDEALAQVGAERDRLAQRADTAEAEALALRDDNAALSGEVEANRYSVRAHWVALAALVMLGGGFAGGWWYADAKQRARHGGFRI